MSDATSWRRVSSLVMAGFGNELVDAHPAADLHHLLEVGQVGFQFRLVGVDKVGVDAHAVDGNAGGSVGLGDLFTSVGSEVG